MGGANGGGNRYLNVYGPHELGIYRISGSTSVVDELRAAFKIHHDVDLFENPPDDLHTVSSLLKGWFRALPDAVLPLDVQKRIYEKCKDNTDDTRPPQAFIDELSNLPPYASCPDIRFYIPHVARANELIELLPPPPPLLASINNLPRLRRE